MIKKYRLSLVTNTGWWRGRYAKDTAVLSVTCTVNNTHVSHSHTTTTVFALHHTFTFHPPRLAYIPNTQYTQSLHYIKSPSTTSHTPTYSLHGNTRNAQTFSQFSAFHSHPFCTSLAHDIHTKPSQLPITPTTIVSPSSSHHTSPLTRSHTQSVIHHIHT